MSQPDLALLRVLKYREQYEKVARFIPKEAMSKKTNAIVKDIGKYFESTEETELDFPSFRSLFFTSYHKGLKEDDIKYYNQVLTQMEKDVPEAVKKNMVNNLLELKMATQVASYIDDYQAGEEIDIVNAVFGAAQQTKDTLERTKQFTCSTFDESTLEEGLSDDTGYLYPLKMLNDSYRRIQGGDATLICGRPGKGKTTFVCQLNHSMAQDMPATKTIVWFNNESRRQKIMSRQIQSAIGKTDAELHAMMKAGTLKPAYIEAMGSESRVEIYDIHGKDHVYIEEILETYGPDGVGAVIFDMLDKVKMPMPTGMREDQRLEELYTWGRELGVFYNCPTFPTSQISVEGAGLLFPAEHMLKDSKTGKQGACDNILMLGSSDDPMIVNTRGISMPKEKVKRAGKDHLMGEVLFNADIGRYIE
tara:strand:+ start:1241 stop:2497 length:1257 start_codon:yes stop_codon:yes gene_type:complete